MNSYIIFCFGNVTGLEDELSDFYHEKLPYLDGPQIMVATFQSESSLDDISKGISEDKIFFLFDISNVDIMKYNLKDPKFIKILFEDVMNNQQHATPKSFKLDEILDKIRQTGVDSLTYDEKRFLDEHGS